MKTHTFIKHLVLTVLILGLFPGCKTENKKLTLTFMEMKGKGPGWGLAVVIQTPEGRTYLFDTGSNYPDAGFDCGKDMIAPFLEINNVTEIDGIVITHSHRDHFGGFEYLMNNFSIKQLYDGGLPVTFTSNVEYDNIYKPEYIAAGGAYNLVKRGDTLKWGKDLEVVILSPPPGYLDLGDDPSQWTDGSTHHLPNLNSIALRLKYKNTVFILCGDVAGKGCETGLQSIVDHFGPEFLQANVLGPGHGGSPYMPFAEAVKPEIVIISCLNGVEGRAFESKKGYGDMGAKVYANCWHGSVQVVSDGNTCTVSTERNDDL